MELPNSKDTEYLNKLRYESGYYPFSFRFDPKKNQTLYNQAKVEGINPDTLNLIGLGDYFNEKFHLQFTNELVALHKDIIVSNEELKELFIAFLNEQELLNRIDEEKFMNTTSQLTAFNLHNATMIRKHLLDNPQNFTDVSEVLICLGNLFLRYMTSMKQNNIEPTLSDISHDEFFKILTNILQVTNRYYMIQNHYDNCLFYNGRIEVHNDEKIYFDSCENKLCLFKQISVTIIENQRMYRFFVNKYLAKENNGFKQSILEKSAKKILFRASIEKGFVKYSLRKRTLEDYNIHLDYMTSVHDYYSYYSLKPLVNFKNLTITDLLHLHSELKKIVSDLYYRDFPVKNENQIKKFKNNFLPRIKHCVLKSYLISVTNYSEAQVELFIELLTVKNNGILDLYETPLLKKDNYYYFPYLPLVRPNHLFLID